jgi:hypothetical protein
MQVVNFHFWKFVMVLHFVSLMAHVFDFSWSSISALVSMWRNETYFSLNSVDFSWDSPSPVSLSRNSG